MTVKQVFNTSAELDYPKVLPTLDLDFANSKTLDPRITFTRASGGSYVGADGLIKYAGVNEPRFDHDPVTGESLGLLIEESRTNLFTWSENAQNAWNIKASSPIILNSSVAPDGSLTADSFIERPSSSGLQDHYLDRTTISQAANVPLTLSIYVKRLSGVRLINLVLFSNSNVDRIGTTFDIDSVSVISTGTGGTGSISNSSIVPLPNGWFCLSISGTPSTSSVTDLRVRIQLINRSTTYIGDGTSGIYLWGAQLEQGSFPTSYIPTQASTRTRAADNASITGKNFSDFYRQDSEGTIYVNCKVNSREYSNQTPFRIQYGDNLRGIGPNLDTRASTNYAATFQTRTDSGTSSVISDTFYTIQDNIKLAGTYGKNEIAAAFNGLVRSSPQSFVFIPMTRMDIGTRIPVSGTQFYYNGTIRRLTYYPKRLPNSQLISLTS
jgi:hypothetical protein